MSLLLLGKYKALAIVSGGASIRSLIGDIRLRHPTPLYSLHKAASRQQPCYSAAAGPASSKGASGLQMQDLDEQAVELVRQIHSTNRKAVFYVAGGGVQVRSQCFALTRIASVVLSTPATIWQCLQCSYTGNAHQYSRPQAVVSRSGSDLAAERAWGLKNSAGGSHSLRGWQEHGRDLRQGA